MTGIVLLNILILLKCGVNGVDHFPAANVISPILPPQGQKPNTPFEHQATQYRKQSSSQSSDYVTFFWDKRRRSAYEYHLAICTDRCLEGRVVHLNSSLGCPNIACFPCDCDIPKCEVYSTCCPDLLEMVRLYRSEFRLVRDNGINLTEIDPFLFTDTFFQAEQGNSSIASSDGMCENSENPDKDLWTKCKPDPVCDIAKVGPSYLQIKSCLGHHTTNQTEKMGCESIYSAQNQSIVAYQHVTDNSTGVSYYNEFCAACNQVQPAMKSHWTVEIECNHFMYVYRALDRDSFLRLSLKLGSTCIVYQKPPGDELTDSKNKENADDKCNKMPTKCNPIWFGSVLSSCNVTGRWKRRDPDIEAACQQMNHQTLRVYDFRQSRDVYFKNIFCAICNTGVYPWFYDICKEQLGDGQIPVSSLPFTLLLGTRARSPMRKVYYSPFADCPPSQWAGPDGLCYPLKCTAGKVLDAEENICKTALPGISGLGYAMLLYYHVRPKTRLGLNNSLIEKAKGGLKVCKSLYLNAFTAKIRTTMSSLSASGEFFFNAILKYSSIAEINSAMDNDERDNVVTVNDTYLQYPVLFALGSNFIDTKKIIRDDFENSVVDELIHKDLEVRIGDDHVLVLTPVTVFEGYNENFMECSSLSKSFENHECCSGRLIRLVFGMEPAESIWSAVDKFLPLNPSLNCPYISFNKSQYTIMSLVTQIPPFLSITLSFDKIQFNFTFPYEINMASLDTESLIVCYDVLQSKVSSMKPSFYLAPEEKDSSILLSQYILTMIFLGLSVICLIVTLMTYFLFSSLRSAAGMNNIFLCLSLVCAQILLIAAAHFKSSIGIICKILAIATHLFWLCMFCWSFACCFHMYRIFTAKTRIATRSPRSLRFEVFKKAVLCAFFPILTVTAVVIYSMHANGELGYGKDGCFLDTGLLLWITVIAPMCGILLCNVFFFVATVWKIHSVRKLQSGENVKKDERQNLYIYIKLSAMTGAFWIVAILAETLDNDPLRYIAILLNGLQGVFIFMSYIANRRVYNMYRRAFRLEENASTTTTSSTDRSTLAKAASDVRRLQEDPKPVAENNPRSRIGSSSTEPTRRISVISKDSGYRVGDDEGNTEMTSGDRN